MPFFRTTCRTLLRKQEIQERATIFFSGLQNFIADGLQNARHIYALVMVLSTLAEYAFVFSKIF
jgi:hypothetical protein